MFKKRCKLKGEDLVPIYNNGDHIGFSYTATVVCNQKNDIVTLSTRVDVIETALCPTKFRIFLNKTTDENNMMVLSSHFLKERDAMFLDLIEIKDVSLRGRGLGTIIFSTWLKLLPEYSRLYNISFSRIEASVGVGNNFTPKVAKKLYHKFNNHRYDHTQHLRLNKGELRYGRLEYTLE